MLMLVDASSVGIAAELIVLKSECMEDSMDLFTKSLGFRLLLRTENQNEQHELIFAGQSASLYLHNFDQRK